MSCGYDTVSFTLGPVMDSRACLISSQLTCRRACFFFLFFFFKLTAGFCSGKVGFAQCCCLLDVLEPYVQFIETSFYFHTEW